MKLNEIISYKPITYNSLMRFSGWGIRFNSKGELAYNISGNKGLEIQLRNKVIIIGTQNIDEFIQATDSLQNNIKDSS